MTHPDLATHTQSHGDIVQVDDVSVQAVNAVFAAVGADATAGTGTAGRTNADDDVLVAHHGSDMVPGQDENDNAALRERPIRDFTWGELDGETFSNALEAAYAEIVHWRRNLFTVPSGSVGKDFTRELTRLFNGFARCAAIESVALCAVMTAPTLLLQKPHPKAKIKECATCLQRRMGEWRAGNIAELVREGLAIQNLARLAIRKNCTEDSKRDGQQFAKWIHQGKTNAALRLLDRKDAGRGILPLEEMIAGADGRNVRQILKDKHPAAKMPQPSVLLSPTSPAEQNSSWHPVIFDSLTGDAIRKAALRVEGGAGPSGLDACAWRRLCTSFGTVSDDLCQAVADTAKRISTVDLPADYLKGYVACRLVPLDKNPGVRPIGICEVVRRIIGKAVLRVLSRSIQETAGTVQLCAGQPAGIEAAIHAMRKIYESDDTEAVLLVDASNAFNQLNRAAALHNIGILCPQLATILKNTYKGESSLFVGGEELKSAEGTTQGDPLAMSMYAIGVLPLIRELEGHNTKQVWYADDATDGGQLTSIKLWWEHLSTRGPGYGYFVNPPKTWLLVKEQHLRTAQQCFAETGINITTEGKRLLGAAIGKKTFVSNYLNEQASRMAVRVERLAEIAVSQPQAAYTALTHGLASEWAFLSRTTDEAGVHLQLVEEKIRAKLIPALTGRLQPGVPERDLFALPARHGGLGITNACKAAATEFLTSQKISEPITKLIIDQKSALGKSCEETQALKRAVSMAKSKEQKEAAKSLLPQLQPDLRRAAEVASEKGASSWLTALPLERHGFALHKGAFRDALCLRYNWHPEYLPTNCVCGHAHNITHALSCPTGGYPTIRHNELRDKTAQLMKEVCYDVSIEPTLQPLSGEHLEGRSSNKEDNARLDIAARGFWGNGSQRAFFDVRVFNPCAQSNRQSQLPATYQRHEREKRRAYQQRVCDIERGSFTPLVFSTAGGMGRAATVFYKRLAGMIADKRGEPYGQVMGWIRAMTTFSLLRSAVLCLRGSRGKHHDAPFAPSTLVLSEARLQSSDR